MKFVDEARIHVKAGKGGDGSASFARARKLDAAMQAFIEDERRRAYRPGAKASKKKARPPAADAAEDAADSY